MQGTLIGRIKHQFSLEDAVRLTTPGLNVKRYHHGNRGTACCQFHQDKRPSMQLDYENGKFVCFSCGAKGDAIDYAANAWGKSVRDTVKVLADQLGISDIGADELKAMRQRITEERQAAETTARFNQAVDDAQDKLSTLLRQMYRVKDGIKTPADLDKPEVVNALNWIGYTEWLVDLMAGNTTEKAQAVRLGRAVLNGQA